MDDTTKGIIDKITVRFRAPTKIPSGQECTIYYDCSKLSPNDLARLAAQAVGHLPENTFDIAVGVAYTGILFAAAIAGGKSVAIVQADGAMYGPALRGRAVMLVDDVVHTGGHLRRAESVVCEQGGKIVGYACIVDRSTGAVTPSGVPLWSACQTMME